MKIRHVKYPQVIADSFGASYQFKDFECEIPVIHALNLLRNSFEFETVDPIPKFNPQTWLKDRKLLWDGPYGKANGFGNSSEQMLLALDKLCDVYAMDTIKLHRIRPQEYSKRTVQIFEKELDRIDIFQIKYGMYQDPEPLHLDYTIAYTMFETDFVPNRRITNINKDKRLFVPCKHNAEVYRKCGVNIPIDVVPLGVNPEIYHYIERMAKKPGDSFTFFIFGGLSRRKGVYEFLEAFTKEFPKDKYPKVKALIKNVKPVLHGFEMAENDGRLEFWISAITEENMVKEMAKIDCGVFPTKGEGFGLPPIECAATGAPTIVTNISGCADYCDPNYFYPLDAKLEVTHDFPPEWGYVGNWGKIDIDQIRHYMRQVYENHADALEKGRQASEWISKNWSYDEAAKRLINKLDQIAKEMS